MCKSVVFYYIVSNTIQDTFLQRGCFAIDTREQTIMKKKKNIGTLVYF